ncbi:tyrosine-type recombinase/integrase [Cryptosporangium aurantiacum]|uniref:tyrosine-type recombinase/integrase n=1 Tax=Cryptosporangium aurantiacum TaxID=134849 RepID=UPI002481AB36|nr:tyrosine-type recombinase/integrase [Cryptosporangium aurantiacum]
MHRRASQELRALPGFGLAWRRHVVAGTNSRSGRQHDHARRRARGRTPRVHDLRHAHASWLLAGGADLQVVKERLGHGSIATTEKYLHTLPGAHDAALEALTAIRGTRDAENPVVAKNETTEGNESVEVTELRKLVATLSAGLAELLGEQGVVGDRHRRIGQRTQCRDAVAE